MKLQNRKEFLNESSDDWMDDYAHKYGNRLLNFFNDLTNDLFFDWNYSDRDNKIQFEFTPKSNGNNTLKELKKYIIEIEKTHLFLKDKIKFYQSPGNNFNKLTQLEFIISKEDLDSKEFKDLIHDTFYSLFND